MCKVSVLMPVYNAEDYLAEAIDSIINQTFTDWEFVIINDGSVDSSKKIIQSYSDKRIRYIENDKNIGVIKTLNKGIDLCKGKYIARMDADDIVHSRRLEKQVLFMDTHPNYVMCGTNGIVIDELGEETGRLRNIAFDEGIRIKLLFSNPFSHPSTIFKRSILTEEKYSEDWKHVEDYELWTRLSKRGKVANLKQRYLNYRWHGENVSATQSGIQEKRKNDLIKIQLLQLEIEATDEDILIHGYTFNNDILSKNQILDEKAYDNIVNWFIKIIKQNDKVQLYSKDYLIAFLWSRWIILCKEQGRMSKVFSANFISFTPSVLSKLIKYIF